LLAIFAGTLFVVKTLRFLKFFWSFWILVRFLVVYLAGIRLFSLSFSVAIVNLEVGYFLTRFLEVGDLDWFGF
jgi:hypothetical protein